MELPIELIILAQSFTGLVELEAQRLVLAEAHTFEERQEGLMDVEEIKSHEGLVFIWQEPGYRSMWMKNTEVPLDMVFVDSKFRIVNIERAYPEPNTPTHMLETYESEEPVQFVVEAPVDTFGSEKNGEKLEIRRWKGENVLDLYS